MTSPTRNRWDFITFLEQLEAEIPADRQVIAILDNLSTHKTREVEDWLGAHPRWRFAFTPKHAEASGRRVASAQQLTDSRAGVRTGAWPPGGGQPSPSGARATDSLR